MNKNKIVLFDLSAYLYRAYFASNKEMTGGGILTGAIHLTLLSVLAFKEYCQTPYFVIACDTKKNFRKERYAEYKANRKAMDDELRLQIPPLKAILKAAGFTLIEIDGAEADDIIGSLSKKALANGFEVIIASADKDLTQLISSADVMMLDRDKLNKSFKEIRQENIAEKFKLENIDLKSSHIAELLALSGDKSDNIAGIDGVGYKTAAKLLIEYGNIENIFNNINKLNGKLKEKFQNASREDIARDLFLSTIKTDFDIPYSMDELKIKPADNKLGLELCAQYDLKLAAKKLFSAEVDNLSFQEMDLFKQEQNKDNNFNIINSLDQLNDLIKLVEDKKEFAFEIKGNFDSSEYIKSEIISIAISVNIDNKINSFYIPIFYNLELSLGGDALRKLSYLFENKEIKKIAFNLKYMQHLLSNYNINILGEAEDIMLLSYCINSFLNSGELKDLAKHYLDFELIDWRDYFSKIKDINFEQLSIQQATEYLCQYCELIFKLYQLLEQHIDIKVKNNIYENIEKPLSKILFDMEKSGIKLDNKLLEKQSYDLEKKIEHIKKNIYSDIGFEFNLNSPKQLREILFSKLNLPIIKKTPSGVPSTDESVLEELAWENEIAKSMLEYRSLAKLKNTYTDTLPKLVQAKTSRLHTTFCQTAVSTGRLSSRDPNVQNIPVKTEEGRKIRKAFIAEKNKKIIAADYSQIELRIMAHISQDKNLISAFNQGKDIHTATACEIFNVPVDQCTKELRRKAKAINFGLIYAMSSFGLAKQISVSRNEAQEYIDLYFSRYKEVQTYMENIKNFARQMNYVETILGRRIYIQDINNKNFNKRNNAQRLAINAPVQGSAADIIKLAMIKMYQEFLNNNSEIKLIMQVHDELVFEVEENKLDRYLDLIKNIMENVIDLSVPLIVEIKYGDNWEEAH